MLWVWKFISRGKQIKFVVLQGLYQEILRKHLEKEDTLNILFQNYQIVRVKQPALCNNLYKRWIHIIIMYLEA